MSGSIGGTASILLYGICFIPESRASVMEVMEVWKQTEARRDPKFFLSALVFKQVILVKRKRNEVRSLVVKERY